MCAGRNHIIIISMINNDDDDDDDDDDDYEKLFEQRKTCSVRWADGMMAAAAGEGGLRSPHHLHRHHRPRPPPRPCHHGCY